MNHQNEMNYAPQSSSSSYDNYYYQSDFQNPNPQFPSAPPDPSIYYSPDIHNPQPSHDPSWYHNHNHNQTPVSGKSDASAHHYTASANVHAVSFDDYGRPIASAANNMQIGATEELNNIIHQSVYGYSGADSIMKDQSSRAPVLQFDDYGRPITYSPRDSSDTMEVEAKEDTTNGVHKFRVVLLSQGAGLQGDMDVLCQIGLDGIQILDPATSHTLKVYSLETVTKWEVLDSSIFAFWTKSSIDMKARCVRLKSNSYTTTKILDTVAAASFQFKEMDGVAISEQQPAEKKKGFPDWINLMKPTSEEKDHWVPDEASTKCTACNTYFGAFVRRHHCRNCGDIFCDKCTQGRIALTAEENAQQVRVCDQCLAEVTQRLSHANEMSGRSSGFNRHEDLAKKLQEEMEKKRKTSDLKSNTSDRKMKEVECPTCTVHLQVDVPTSGSKTIECSVCQHPFLVNAH